ncbi:MAG: glycosyltransferase family 4 protein [candidate division Zixibacteria bacterium]|nr:glycosyltransferase family 4 protein [candidate division Zixibacteria bacterium]
MNKVLFLDTEHKRFSSVFFEELSLKVGEMDIIKMKMPPFHLNYGPTFFSKITRVWLPFFLFAIRGFRKGLRYDIVVSWSGVVGLFLGFFKLIFFLNKPKLFVTTFIFRPRKNKIATSIRFWFFKACVKKMDGIICHSSDEANYYKTLFHLNDNKIKFVPYGIELPKVNFQNNGEEPYIASAGKSNRDYELLKTAITGIETKVKIYCSRDYKALTDDEKNPNLEVHFDTPLKEFLEGLNNALFVVIPLKFPEFSSGQLVLLQAMALGKTVIATDCWGTRDYIKHMENGILVAPGDEFELREKILYLSSNPREIERMGRNAKETVEESFNIRSFASAIGNYIKERGC